MRVRASLDLGFIALLTALCGCGSPDGATPPPPRADAASDVTDAPPPDAPDVELDPVDVPASTDGPMADAGIDATLDAAPDAAVDAPEDALVDAARDATPDAPGDAGSDGGGCAGSTCGGACVDHATSPNVCGTAPSLGRWCGDANCNAPLCRATAYRTVAMRSGRSSEWFRASSVECSLCSGNLLTRITLAVPAGVDYDLFVHRPCGTIIARSIRGAGVADQVELDVPDRGASDDGFDYYIEVRHVSGASCEPYQLTIEARGADATNC